MTEERDYEEMSVNEEVVNDIFYLLLIEAPHVRLTGWLFGLPNAMA